MNWSDDAPARFSLHYQWPSRLQTATGPAHALIANSLEDAKLEAAILYASADPSTSPNAYRIVEGPLTVVYRYPEHTTRQEAVTRRAR